jgi:hypothetical protein
VVALFCMTVLYECGRRERSRENSMKRFFTSRGQGVNDDLEIATPIHRVMKDHDGLHRPMHILQILLCFVNKKKSYITTGDGPHSVRDPPSCIVCLEQRVPSASQKWSQIENNLKKRIGQLPRRGVWNVLHRQSSDRQRGRQNGPPQV